MTIGWGEQAQAIDIFEVGPVLTKIQSFCVGSLGQHGQTGTFSPTTYQISVFDNNELCILDIQTSECLLKKDCEHFSSSSHCFSPDGSLFAVSLSLSVHIWKYDSGHYTPWRVFPAQSISLLQFSSTLSSIAASASSALKVWHLDLLPTVVHQVNDHPPLVALSHQGTYMATAHHKGCVVTITNLLLQTTPKFIMWKW